MSVPARDAMTREERRAGMGLAAIFALRMLGLFLILPVFAVHAADHPRGRRPHPGGPGDRRLRPHPGLPADRLRRRLRPLRPQAGDRLRPGAVRARQRGRGARRRHPHDHRRPRAAGRRGDLRRGHRARRRPHPRPAPHQGDGDDRLLDRPGVRALDGGGAAALCRGRHGRHLLAHRRARRRRDRRAAVGGARCARRCRAPPAG